MRYLPSLPYPWQQTAWQLLGAQLEQRQMPHALMLAGPQGIGKRHLAQALVQRMLCLAPASGTACGKRSEEHTSELQSRGHLVCRLLLEKKKRMHKTRYNSRRHNNR